MKWKVTCSGLKDDDATHPGFEIVTADIQRIELSGALTFVRIVPSDNPFLSELVVRGFNALKWDDYVIVEDE